MYVSKRDALNVIEKIAPDISSNDQHILKAFVKNVRMDGDSVYTAGFTYVKAYGDPKWLGLFLDEDCVTIVKDPALIKSIKSLVPEKKSHPRVNRFKTIKTRRCKK